MPVNATLCIKETSSCVTFNVELVFALIVFAVASPLMISVYKDVRQTKERKLRDPVNEESEET